MYCKVVKYVKNPLEKPKRINKNAGKQHSVDKSAVVTAPIIAIFSFFFFFFFHNMFM